MTAKRASKPKAAPPVETHQALNPADLNRLFGLLERVIEGQAAVLATGGQPAGDPSDLQSALKDISRLAASSERTAEEFKRQVRRSNAANMDNADPFRYDPRCEICKAGEIHEETKDKRHPKPPLKYDTYFCGGPQRLDMLSVLEVELYNSFTHSVECRDGDWSAVIEKDGTRKRLKVEVPYQTFDGRLDLPPLDQILTELLYGETIADPAATAALVLELQKRIQSLESELQARS